MQTIDVLPEQLVAASGPLSLAGDALEEVANSRRALQHLVEASPSARLADSFRGFLAAWELTVWSAGDGASALARYVGFAGRYYAQREAAITSHIPVTNPRADVPPLRDHVAPALVPHPAPQAAPSPAP